MWPSYRQFGVATNPAALVPGPAAFTALSLMRYCLPFTRFVITRGLLVAAGDRDTQVSPLSREYSTLVIGPAGLAEGNVKVTVSWRSAGCTAVTVTG